jgi:hypothetical protein
MDLKLGYLAEEKIPLEMVFEEAMLSKVRQS